MTKECLVFHRIVITNLSNGEIVERSILLIKGRVEPHCLQTENIKLIVNNSLSNTNDSVEITKISFGGDFKFLIDLFAFTNEDKLFLLLEYCKASFEIEINIKKKREYKYKIQPVYIICHSNTEQKEANENDLLVTKNLIDLNLRLVQCVYAEKLREVGFGRSTFTLNKPCQIFQSKLSCEEVWKRTENELWEYFVDELTTTDSNKLSKGLKYVGFIACTKYDGDSLIKSGDFSYANIRKYLKGHAALGGGPLALFGSAYFYAWPRVFNDILKCFQNSQHIDLSLYPDESNYRRTFGGVYATTLGAICHEIGHIFDLGHTQDGVMGDGFDYLNRVFIIETKTEDLPGRVFCQSDIDKNLLHTNQQKLRFTQIRKPNSRFLKKYHEQKHNDSFFFTRNCAVILAHHRWLRTTAHCDSCLLDNAKAIVHLDQNTNTIEALLGEILKIIEIRRKDTSLVDSYYELNSNVTTFQLSMKDCSKIMHKETHYIFVMTANGYIQRFFD